MTGSVNCVGNHIMMLNQHVKELQKTHKTIKKEKPAADHEDVKKFLLHAARIRAAADQLLQEGLITQGSAIVEGCCGLAESAAAQAAPSRKAQKAAKKK